MASLLIIPALRRTVENPHFIQFFREPGGSRKNVLHIDNYCCPCVFWFERVELDCASPDMSAVFKVEELPARDSTSDFAVPADAFSEFEEFETAEGFCAGI